MTLTLLSEQNKIPSKIQEKEGIDMSGGYYRAKGRKYFTVWYPFKGEKILIRKALDGGKIYHEKQAERVLEKIRGEVDADKFDPSIYGKDKTLLIKNAWETYQNPSNVTPQRERQREVVFKKYIEPYFEKKSIREIRTIDISAWISEISKFGLMPSSIRSIKAIFRAFLWFHSDNLVRMPKFPIVSVPKKSKPWLTKEEQEKVLEFIASHHQGIFRFLMVYGCRSSEACNLKRSEIDWEKRIFTLKERKANDENNLPILPEIEKYLVGGAMGVSGRCNAVGMPPQPGLFPPTKVFNLVYIFSNKNGRPYFRQGLYNIWMKANRKAHQKYGIKILSLKNATRHSKAWQMAEREEPIWVIARALGNSIKVVEENYGGITLKRIAKGLEGK